MLLPFPLISIGSPLLSFLPTVSTLGLLFGQGVVVSVEGTIDRVVTTTVWLGVENLV